MSDIATRSRANLRGDALYQLLRAAILNGELAPEERLVERDVARRYSVSRTPVREAIHRLEMDGLVRSTRRGATVVAVGAGELAELCTVRQGLEALAARLAASSASDVELGALEGILEAAREAVEAGDLARQVELNHFFHETIWNATRNRYLVRQLELLRSLIEQGRSTTLREAERQEESLLEHEELAQALLARDPDRAEAAAERHFGRAMILRLLDEQSASSIARPQPQEPGRE